MIADRLAEAHKIAAGATGRLSIALSRRKLQPDTIETVATDLRRALAIVEGLAKPKQPWARK
jgi:hypothetical protein